jgi:diguanylate cyclase (GGDEF)-like protein
MLKPIERERGSVAKPIKAKRREAARWGAAGGVSMACAFPAWAAPGVGVAGGWLGLVLALLVGIGLGYLGWGLRAKRDRAGLAKRLEEYDAGRRKQDEQLQAARQGRDALADQLQQQTVEFARQAHEDALTGLPNGRAFDEGFAHHFARAKRHGQPLCLMLLDLDHLGQVNEHWSHAVGDEVLAEAARLLRSVCRTSDLPARLGGDGFAVILTDTDLEGGKRFGQRLHAAFASCRSWHSGEVGPNYVSVSAGLVQLGEEDQAPAQLRQRADRALYLAKHAGGARTSLG